MGTPDLRSKGVYADDCIMDRIQKAKIYIVGTNDRVQSDRVMKEQRREC